MKPLIGITMGDPIGVGPEILLKAAGEKRFFHGFQPVVFGDYLFLRALQKRLVSRKKIRPIPLRKISHRNLEGFQGGINILPIIDFQNVPKGASLRRCPSAWAG